LFFSLIAEVKVISRIQNSKSHFRKNLYSRVSLYPAPNDW